MPVSAADGNAAIQGYFPGDLGVELVSVEAEEVRAQVWQVRIERGERLAAFFTCTQMILRPA
jgi:hypothetical protein